MEAFLRRPEASTASFVEGLLQGPLAEGMRGGAHALAGVGTQPPAGGGKDPPGIAMLPPVVPEFLIHQLRQRHAPVLAALAVAHGQARGFDVVDGEFDALIQASRRNPQQ